ncbi:aldose 1-epimerase family protein [Muribaculum intestinale]|uniref:aldose 1-epimerase family protein n=1 Tax=Muribaculum intestinale TaxID=1796646 RepID=UPI0025AA1F61|nr:aldose 1-epimerase family protein [Muribaculum intestinale]
MKQTLSNDLLTVTIDAFGAELQEIVNKRTGWQYLWHGDKTFWGRRSPVLFPIVGSVWDGCYRMDGKEFRLGQHGFARDREFEIITDTPDDEAWFSLESDDSTLALYPRRFRLEIGYRLQEARLTVMWRVINLDDREMSFQIGAHPAFNYPDFNAADDVHGYFCFDSRSLEKQVIEEKGCIGNATEPVALDEDGMLPVMSDTFCNDAIVLADHQVHRVSMLDKNRAPYLSVLFQAPLVGLWSPSAQAPFACIEPWWGRCDRVGFSGDFSERDYVNKIAPGETFSVSYMVIFDNF